jgi:hypothetical protein
MSADRLEMRARDAGYVVIAAILAPLIVLTAFGAARSHDWQDWIVVLGPSVILAAAWIWLACFSIQVSDRKLRYRTAFADRTIGIDDIGGIDFEVGSMPWSERYRPWHRLVIQPKAEAGQRPITINARVFSRDELQHLVLVIAPTWRGLQLASVGSDAD